jgi:hypothetical protein
VAFSQSITMSLLGVIATSFCSGLGEVTYLQYSSFFDRQVIAKQFFFCGKTVSIEMSFRHGVQELEAPGLLEPFLTLFYSSWD